MKYTQIIINHSDGGINCDNDDRIIIPISLTIFFSILRCGQKKKLVINNGNGTMEERKPSGLNGEASKSQEMVHLVNKGSSETPDQFMTADETRNLQNVDMKIGV